MILNDLIMPLTDTSFLITLITFVMMTIALKIEYCIYNKNLDCKIPVMSRKEYSYKMSNRVVVGALTMFFIGFLIATLPGFDRL